jgi:hypothetical protein
MRSLASFLWQFSSQQQSYHLTMDNLGDFPPNFGELYMEEHLVYMKEANDDGTWNWAWISTDTATNDQRDEHMVRAALYARLHTDWMQRSQVPGHKSPEEADNSNPPSDKESQEEALAQEAAAEEADYSNQPSDAESQEREAVPEEEERPKKKVVKAE